LKAPPNAPERVEVDPIEREVVTLDEGDRPLEERVVVLPEERVVVLAPLNAPPNAPERPELTERELTDEAERVPVPPFAERIVFPPLNVLPNPDEREVIVPACAEPLLHAPECVEA
jgi:hypothetical protein